MSSDEKAAKKRKTSKAVDDERKANAPHRVVRVDQTGYKLNTEFVKRVEAQDYSKKVALITGITGQDGSYLAEMLLKKGYTVHGIIRRSSSFNTGRIDHIYKDRHVTGAKMTLHYGDLADSTNLSKIIADTKPDEIYNLAAQSHVMVSFSTSEYYPLFSLLTYIMAN